MEPAGSFLSVQVMLRDDSHAESWRRVLEHLKTSRATYWLVTGGAHGTPHVATTFSSRALATVPLDVHRTGGGGSRSPVGLRHPDPCSLWQARRRV